MPSVVPSPEGANTPPQKSLNSVADGLREAVGIVEWFAIPLVVRKRIVFHVASLDGDA